MNKLNVCIMGQDCEKYLPMCLESVKDADNIVYVDGGSKYDSDEDGEPTNNGPVWDILERNKGRNKESKTSSQPETEKTDLGKIVDEIKGI